MSSNNFTTVVGKVLFCTGFACLFAAQASAQQAPILDLNSGPSPISLVEHGDFSLTNTWSATGKWNYYGGMACTYPPQSYGTPNAGPHALNAPSIAGWAYGPSSQGGARLSFDIQWTDGLAPSQQNVLTIDIGTTTFATITTSSGVGAAATVTYQNGAVGNLLALPASSSFTTLVLQLPTSVQDYANLSFNYVGEESSSTDTLCIDNVVGEGYRDASPGRDNLIRFDEGSAPTAIVGPAANIGDVDSGMMQSATVSFTNLLAGDVVLLNNQPMVAGSGGLVNGIAYSVTAGSGGALTLVLTGPAASADYIGALQLLKFQPTASPLDITNRVVTFVVNDGANNSNTATATIEINAKPIATNNGKTIDKTHAAAVTGNLLTDDDGDGVDHDPNGDAYVFSTVAGMPVTGPISLTGNYGNWTINQNGGYSYLLNTSNPAVAGLAHGQSLQDSVVYRIAEMGTQLIDGSFNNNFVGSSQAGWYAPQNAGLEDASSSGSGVAYQSSPDGGQFVTLTGNGYDPLGSSGIIRQTLSGLVVGAAYELQFHQTISSHNAPGIGIVPGHVQVTFGSEVHDSPVLTAPTLGVAAPWDLVTMSFVATASTQLLELRGVPEAINGWALLAIDGVSISRTSGSPLFGEGTLKITIVGTNTPPVSSNASKSTPQNTSLADTLPAASDVDGDMVTYAPGATLPSHGVVTIQADGSFVYAPTNGYSGPDSFSFVVSDGLGGSNEYTVSLNVTRVASGPSSAHGVPLGGPLASVLLSVWLAGIAMFRVRRGVAGHRR